MERGWGGWEKIQRQKEARGGARLLSEATCHSLTQKQARSPAASKLSVGRGLHLKRLNVRPKERQLARMTWGVGIGMERSKKKADSPEGGKPQNSRRPRRLNSQKAESQKQKTAKNTTNIPLNRIE